MKIIKTTKGFTIVELLFSSVIFSAVLMLCLTALVQIGRMYYKGVTTAQTQQASRGILDELTQSMQFSGANIAAPRDLTGSAAAAPMGPTIAPGSPPVAVGFFCIGATRYTYAMDRQQSNTNDITNKKIMHALWVDEPGVCGGITDATVSAYFTTFPVDLTQDVPSAYNGRDLLSDNMRLLRLIIRQPTGVTDGSVWQILLTVAYGDDDLLKPDPLDATRRICAGVSAGTQFCAFSELSTIVKRRISVL